MTTATNMEPIRHDGHKQDEHPEFLTKKQVAELLQCSQRQVELLTNRGRICKPIYLGTSSPRWSRAGLLASLGAVEEGGAE